MGNNWDGSVRVYGLRLRSLSGGSGSTANSFLKQSYLSLLQSVGEHKARVSCLALADTEEVLISVRTSFILHFVLNLRTFFQSNEIDFLD